MYKSLLEISVFSYEHQASDNGERSVSDSVREQQLQAGLLDGLAKTKPSMFTL